MVVSKRKRWCCAAGAKLSTCLAKVVLRLHPPQKILACLSLSNGTPRENVAPVEPESSVEICPSGKSQLKTSPLVEEAGKENFSMGGASPDSDLGSGSESSTNTDSELASLTGPKFLRRNRPACHLRKTHL